MFWIQTQNPLRFIGFVVVVVVNFRPKHQRFPRFVFGMCLFQKKTDNSMLGLSVFPMNSDIFIGRIKKHTFAQ